MKRVSTACTYCRRRRSKCDLDSEGSPGTPPCRRCIKDNRECVLGSSNRGGRRIRKDRQNNTSLSTSAAPISSLINAIPPNECRSSSTGPTNNTAQPPQSNPNHQQMSHYASTDNTRTVIQGRDDETLSSEDSNIDSKIPIPHNPSDAWQLLADVAKGADKDVTSPHYQSQAGHVGSPRDRRNGSNAYQQDAGIQTYRLVQDRCLTVDQVYHLITRYSEHFHCYLPLVPRKYFELSSLDEFSSKEQSLLTAVLTIASKDLADTPQVHETCSRYMHELISGIAAGTDCEVEAVEALLLLAEWEPQGLRERIETVGRGEEDRAAWMHVGLALRTGYFLGLDRTSFRNDAAEENTIESRKRLAWATCYICDRLISVRIGRAFWSRGPGPMTGLSTKDFPSLQPRSSADEDLAKIFQATLDLTQLYSNVHDVLYSGMRTSGQMMLMGDYVKYVDDFRMAISRWNRIWGTLTCAPNIKVTLQMSFEYLRLYTNAFAFQAAISQALHSKPKGNAVTQKEQVRAAFSDIASMPDARFIYESVDAAKSYLTILNNLVDAERHLHFMPLRYFLYSIYSAVFLYKARSFGVMNPQEETGVREMIVKTVDQLQRASVSPQDSGSRYARLLELLWLNPKPNSNAIAQESRLPPSLPNSGSLQQPSPLTDPTYADFSPSYDFSWLDLEAVGDYVVSTDQMATSSTLPLGDGRQDNTAYASRQDRSPWQTYNNWPVEVNGTLLF